MCSEDDYSGLPEMLTFSEAGSQCFYIVITQDSLLEGTENFYIVLATRDDDIIFDIRSAIVYITDDNSMLIVPHNVVYTCVASNLRCSFVTVNWYTPYSTHIYASECLEVL